VLTRPLISRSVLLVLALTLLGGCGGGSETVKVKGQVTFGGGPWPKPGAINFLPADKRDPDWPLHPGTAQFNTDGFFTVTSFRPGDGLLPGKYRVSVDCWEVPPTMDGPPAKSWVPPKYSNAQTSGLEITVQADGPTSDLRFDIPKP
jgi:hypothetical protein